MSLRESSARHIVFAESRGNPGKAAMFGFKGLE
jgi:hypothetical protein